MQELDEGVDDAKTRIPRHSVPWGDDLMRVNGNPVVYTLGVHERTGAARVHFPGGGVARLDDLLVKGNRVDVPSRLRIVCAKLRTSWR